METVLIFTYLGDSLSAGGGCAAAFSVRTRCGWVKFRECTGHCILRFSVKERKGGRR